MAEDSVPILPSRDLDETLAFYERLGFENRGVFLLPAFKQAAAFGLPGR